MTVAAEQDKEFADDARKMARLLIQHHFGKPPHRLMRQGSGQSNFVFLAIHEEGEFIVRISPMPARLNAFIKEQWASSKAREVGVPTPEILEVGNEVVPHPYMITQKVSGKEATHHPERMRILREMGRYAALIHSVSTTGFGRTFDWSGNQLSRNETWNDFLDGELKIDDRLAVLEKHRMIDPPQLKKLCEMLKALPDHDLKPTLNHGDLRLKNIIADKRGEIQVILDWEHCMSNLAPHWDASIALHDLSIDEKQEFLAGYGLTEKEIAAISPVMKALNLINYAPEIERFAEARASERLEQYRVRLRGHLDLYSL